MKTLPLLLLAAFLSVADPKGASADQNAGAIVNLLLMPQMMPFMEDGAPKEIPCIAARLPDGRCPDANFRDPASPSCVSVLASLANTDRTDWESRRRHVENAKRLGCAPYQR